MSRDCVFCDYDGPSPVLEDDGSTFIIEPLEPVVEGHRLLIPHLHVEHLGSDPLVAETLMHRVSEFIHNMQSWHRGWSCNVITSIGAPATQTVKHLHVHVVPRREGDGLMLPWSRPSDTEEEA